MKMSPLLLLLVQLLGVHLLVFQNVRLAGAVVKGGYTGGSASNVNFNYVTHVYYAFAGVDPTSYQLVLDAGDNTIGTFVATAKKSNPSVVTLLSIGGAAAPQATFAEMVSTSSRRKVFIDSSIELARQHGFEGLDLDWESPQTQGAMENLATLLKEWRAAAVTESQSSGKTELLLTGAPLILCTLISLVYNNLQSLAHEFVKTSNLIFYNCSCCELPVNPTLHRRHEPDLAN